MSVDNFTTMGEERSTDRVEQTRFIAENLGVESVQRVLDCHTWGTTSSEALSQGSRPSTTQDGQGTL